MIHDTRYTIHDTRYTLLTNLSIPFPSTICHCNTVSRFRLVGPLSSAVLGHALQPAQLGPVEGRLGLVGAQLGPVEGLLGLVGAGASRGNGGVTVEASKDLVEASKDLVEASMDTVEARKDTVEASMDTVEASMDTVEASKDTVEASMDTVEAIEGNAVGGQWWQQYYSSQESREEQGRSEALWGRWVAAVPSSQQGETTLQQICVILHGVLTISSDIGCFEPYHTITYPTRPDKIRKKKITDLVRLDLALPNT